MGAESTTRRLGRKSIVALVEHLEYRYSRTQLERITTKYSLEDRFQGYKGPAINNVFLPLIEEHADLDEVKNAIELLEEEITIPAFYAFQSDEYDESPRELYESFRNALRADGLDLVEGRVAPFFSPTVDSAKEQGALESSLDEHGFTVARNHLDQAVDNAASGNWEAANGQVRAFLEALCNEIAKAIWNNDSPAPVGGDARQLLEAEGFVGPDEANLLRALFKVLSGEGSHPGTSSEDDCHRRRLMAVATANYYLERLDDWNQG